MNVERFIVSAAVTCIAVVAFVAVIESENNEERWQDAERRYADVTSAPAPTVTATVKVTSPPKTLPPRVVTKTIRVTERASRSATRGSSSNATLACIRKHESGSNYRAVNSTGKFRGAYQLSRVYSSEWARRAGQGQWASKPADQWPPVVQDAVAAHMGRNGWGAWSKFTSYDCPGF